MYECTCLHININKEYICQKKLFILLIKHTNTHDIFIDNIEQPSQ